MEIKDDQKFEAVKYRHEDQAKLLQFLTANDIKVFSSYFTLQLVFGGFLVANPIDNIYTKIGLLIIDIVISITAFGIIYRSFQRRREAATTIENCNDALGFENEGIYLEGRTLNAQTIYRPWNTFYYLGIFIATAGIAFIIFTSDLQKDSNVKPTNTEQTNDK